MTLTNKGNYRDVVTLTSTTPGDWKIKFDNQDTKKVTIEIDTSQTITVEVTAPDDARNADEGKLTITAKSEDGRTKTLYYLRATVETSVIKFGALEIIGDTTVGSKVTIKLVVKNDGDVDTDKDLVITFTDKGKKIREEKIERLAKNSEVEIQFTYEITEGDHDIKAQCEWSDDTIKKNQAFSSETELFSGNILWIVIIGVAVVVFIITIILASVSQRRGIPKDLREEIAIAKQARKLGKSDEEIAEMRRKKIEKFGGAGAGVERTKPGVKGERELKKPEEEKESPRKKAAGKAVRIKCPKCDRIQAVKSTKRPIEFPCSNCGMKLVLKK